MINNISALQKQRMTYKPKLPKTLQKGIKKLVLLSGEKTTAQNNVDQIKELFPNTFGQPLVYFKNATKSKTAKKITKLQPKNVGIILSGGQAPGGHNVVAGLFDALKQADENNKLYGFLGGPSGIVDGKYVEITHEFMDKYRNTGGFDIIGSGRTKLETQEQFMKAWNVCQNLDINAIVIIGGDDSNTNAALMAEWFVAHNANIQVIGCPKTIDGDLKNSQIETSFGFDTATKTYAELVGNIGTDVLSAKKYWHFIKMMGRNATHVALEVALQTQPNITIISEEIEQDKVSLDSIIGYIANIVVQRANAGKNFGTVLVPEGLIEFVPEMKVLIENINDVFALISDEPAYIEAKNDGARFKLLVQKLETINPESAKVFDSLPTMIKAQLLMDRDPHGNVQVSKIETERLLIEMLKTKLENLKQEGIYNGKFNFQTHFFGYEGRCAMPSNFDADYCYSLGFNAFALIQFGLTGYISAIKNLAKGAKFWTACGAPLTMMMNMEKRHGQYKPVIKKALVDLNGPVFKYLEKNREEWALNECYRNPGAIQYFGPQVVTDTTTMTLALETNDGLVISAKPKNPISSFKAFLKKYRPHLLKNK